MHLERLGLFMIRKKIVFIIVEGKSDQKALGIFFERFFNDKHVEIHIYHGDITSEKGVTDYSHVKAPSVFS